MTPGVGAVVRQVQDESERAPRLGRYARPSVPTLAPSLAKETLPPSQIATGTTS
jgi:hypothetical protein